MKTDFPGCNALQLAVFIGSPGPSVLILGYTMNNSNNIDRVRNCHDLAESPLWFSCVDV
jgi:hypothetical protein